MSFAEEGLAVSSEETAPLTHSKMEIDASRGRFPFSIVWTPLPVLGWICPLIGHMGICLSNGVNYNFAGPYFILEDEMAFGRVTRYCQLDPNKVRNAKWTTYDDAVKEGNSTYEKRMHNLLCDNCHSHVAECLNNMGYKGRKWGAWGVFFEIMLHGKFVNAKAALQTVLPFLILVAIVLAISLGTSMGGGSA